MANKYYYVLKLKHSVCEDSLFTSLRKYNLIFFNFSQFCFALTQHPENIFEEKKINIYGAFSVDENKLLSINKYCCVTVISRIYDL